MRFLTILLTALLVVAPIAANAGTHDNNIYFASGSSTLSDAAKAKLDKIAKKLTEGCEKKGAPWKHWNNHSKFLSSGNTGGGQAKLIGHTDTVGDANVNQALSQRRVNSVYNRLILRGVNASQLATRAKGETSLKVSTKDNVAEKFNRRVEIVIY